MPEYAYLFAVILFGSFVQGISGFGIILVSLPLLALEFDIRFLVPLISLCALALNALISLQLQKSIQLKIVLSMLAASCLGLPLGVYGLKYLPANVLLFILGAVVLLYLAFMTFMPARKRILHSAWSYVAGFFGGICGGGIGANGPPIIMYLYMQPWDAQRIRATMVSYFLFAGLGNCLSHYAGGLITTKVISALAVGIPATILGKILSSVVYKRLNEQQVRLFVRFLICFLGIMLIAKSLL
ncbi:sulfite exporter TauE/SafE family protein [Pseudodesulfovibrio senegalensis]|uniref:Probable membrane transporter protein n=1 Tax=Pseudodesulfovibrio senegalensis TaxID=1721087 RepID=A0A6N6N924_9BACT|nr:sulfite exporter TauE/SafE family protein [Pseudodesulfovibrio senegalensis]KAB1443735.1 sulfite exporter TauE/SafE family protein [Pseudodesulfovibrio senegalensis]